MDVPFQPAIPTNPVPTVETRNANPGGAHTLSPVPDTIKSPILKDRMQNLVASCQITKVQNLLHVQIAD
jgi:hypothetical protein